MKRKGFFGMIAGALAAAALPMPKLPAPMFNMTFGMTDWRGVVGRTPIVLTAESFVWAAHNAMYVLDKDGKRMLSVPRVG